MFHPLLPAQHRDSMLPFGHVLDDAPAPLQRNRRKGQRLGVTLRFAVPGLDPRQPFPPGRLAPEATHRDLGDRGPQPAPALLIREAAQDPPRPRRRLKASLNQVLGQRPVATGQHAGVPEQASGIGGKARGEFIGVTPGDRLLTHPGLRTATGRARRLAGPHRPRQSGQVAQTRSSHQASARPGLPHHGPRGTMSKPVPDRRPSHHHRQGHGRADREHARRSQSVPPRDQ